MATVRFCFWTTTLQNKSVRFRPRRTECLVDRNLGPRQTTQRPVPVPSRACNRRGQPSPSAEPPCAKPFGISSRHHRQCADGLGVPCTPGTRMTSSTNAMVTNVTLEIAGGGAKLRIMNLRGSHAAEFTFIPKYLETSSKGNTLGSSRDRLPPPVDWSSKERSCPKLPRLPAPLKSGHVILETETPVVIPPTCCAASEVGRSLPANGRSFSRTAQKLSLRIAESRCRGAT